MILRYFTLIISSALTVIAIQDDLLHPKVMQILKKGVVEESELGYFRRPNENGPFMEMIKDNALHELLKDEDYDLTARGNTITRKINIFEERAKLKGLESIRAFTAHIGSKLNLSNAILDPIVTKFVSKYVVALKEYFSGLYKESFDSKVEQEYVVLDMVNVASLIRRKVEKKLFKEILAKANNNTPKDEIEILTETLDTFLDNDKRQEIDFICTNFKVCRSNPTFSDYVFKLLKQVLKLENDKFHYFLITCSNALLKKQLFLESLLRGEIFALLRKKMIEVPKANVQELRNAISFLRSVVLRRYKISPNNAKKNQIKDQCAYVILDIVDVSFGIDGNDLYGPQMDKTISSIIHWAGRTGYNNLETVLHAFMQYIIEALNYNLNTRAREEIKGLVDMLFDYRHHDEPKKLNETVYLLTEGSKFIKGLLHPSKQKNSFL